MTDLDHSEALLALLSLAVPLVVVSVVGLVQGYHVHIYRPRKQTSETVDGPSDPPDDV